MALTVDQTGGNKVIYCEEHKARNAYALKRFLHIVQCVEGIKDYCSHSYQSSENRASKCLPFSILYV